jgi:polyhydroxybutyrate depolymerase
MKKTKTIRSVIHCILIFIVLIFAQNISYAQIQPGSFEFDGLTREYAVFLPQNYQPNMPVVISLHGAGGTVQNQMNLTLMNEYADTSGFIVVYAQAAINGLWNIGVTWGPVNVDDVGFISALIDTLDAHYNIDMARIYCTGYSMGAAMTNRLAAELTHRLAAVAPIAGGNLGDFAFTWNPIRPIPMLHMHGTADQSLLYNGGTDNGGSDYWSVEESLNFWIQNNNCSLPADTILLPDINTGDNSTVVKISWTNCSNNSSVIHYKIINGGHTWPGGFNQGHGNTNRDINANEEIWNFFKNYENPLVNIARAKTVEVFPGYLDPQGDTLFVKVHITNPENDSVSVYAKINGEGVSFSDSLLLYDDGLHFDENPNDNVWGNAKLLSGWEKDIYRVETYTRDFSLGTIHKYRFLNYFTTTGPVVFVDYEIFQQSANFFTLQYSLRNDGLTNTATAVSAVVLTSDTNVTNIPGTSHFGNIEPGQVKSPFSFPIIIYTQNNPTSIDFIVHIFSNGNFFWSDSFTVDVPVGIAENEINLPIEYELKQNYPNPFNPSTRIKYQIPDAGLVSLQVYNLLGEVVATLVNDEKPAGNYEVQFDATGISSGVYFYSLQAGDFVETKKLILLR